MSNRQHFRRNKPYKLPIFEFDNNFMITLITIWFLLLLFKFFYETFSLTKPSQKMFLAV